VPANYYELVPEQAQRSRPERADLLDAVEKTEMEAIFLTGSAPAPGARTAERISLARRSSRFSLSSSASRGRSSVLRPERIPLSISAWATHRRRARIVASSRCRRETRGYGVSDAVSSAYDADSPRPAFTARTPPRH
jgi:hypothetical protein